MTQDEQDRFWLSEAYRKATQSSTDPSSQIGAVIVDSGRGLISWGTNHFPEGVAESAARWQRPLKYSYVEHAERNAIYHAARNGCATQGATMYAPWFACADCARAIIQAGISEVVGHQDASDKTMERWAETINLADGMLSEAGVKFRRVTGKLYAPAIRFDGEVWHP